MEPAGNNPWNEDRVVQRASRSAPPTSVRRAELVFRVLFSLIFVIAGGGHLARPEVFVERLLHSSVGRVVAELAPAQFLVIATGVLLLVAGLGLFLGYRTRLSAVALGAVLVPISISTHIGMGGDPGPLLKNIALLGGLIHFAAVGATELSLDGRLRRGPGK